MHGCSYYGAPGGSVAELSDARNPANCGWKTELIRVGAKDAGWQTGSKRHLDDESRPIWREYRHGLKAGRHPALGGRAL